jgi:hypothetical protein
MTRLRRIGTYVTTTAPFALTQSMITCAGVALRRLAAAATGASTGPPGNLVMGLCEREDILHEYVSEQTHDCIQPQRPICFRDNALLVRPLDQRFVLSVAVWVECDLIQSSVSQIHSEKVMRRAWLTDGLYFTFFEMVFSCSRLKLLTPMLLQRHRETFSTFINCRRLAREMAYFAFPSSLIFSSSAHAWAKSGTNLGLWMR